MLYGGTTPTHTFELPFDASGIAECKVTYAGEGVSVVKATDDCVLSGTAVSVTLTQADTLLLDNVSKVKVQLRVVLEDGTALATKPAEIKTLAALDEDVIECQTSS